jgi:hypothetical protein
VVVRLNDKKYRVPAGEANTKKGEDIPKFALQLARDVLYRATHAQHEAAGKCDSMQSVPRSGLVISAHAPGNEYLLAGDPMPLAALSALGTDATCCQ